MATPGSTITRRAGARITRCSLTGKVRRNRRSMPSCGLQNSNEAMMIDLGTMELWFATGSQHLYGDETLKTVAVHAGEVATALTKSKSIPLTVVPKPVLTTPD